MSTTSPLKMERRQTAELCASCGKHPRLGSLSRCVHCVRASAEEDRQSRLAAEQRVNTRAELQAALERLGDVFLEFATSPEGMRFLEIQQSENVTASTNSGNPISLSGQAQVALTALVADITNKAGDTMAGALNWNT